MTPRTCLFVLDEPTGGIQPSSVKDIGRAIEYLGTRGGMAIILVGQYLEFARDLADDFAVMGGVNVVRGRRAEMVETDVERYLAV